ADVSWASTLRRSSPSTTHSPVSGPLVTADAPWPKWPAKTWARFGASTTSRTVAQMLSTTLVSRCQRIPHTVTPTAPRMARTATRTRGWTPRLAWAAPWIPRREASIINRRGLAALAGLSALIAGCGYTGPSAATLLQRAKTTFDQTSAFHIQLTSQGTAGTGIELTAAEGDAVRPDGFTGTLTVEEAGFPLQIKVISAGGKFYVQLP